MEKCVVAKGTKLSGWPTTTVQLTMAGGFVCQTSYSARTVTYLLLQERVYEHPNIYFCFVGKHSSTVNASLTPTSPPPPHKRFRWVT